MEKHNGPEWVVTNLDEALRDYNAGNDAAALSALEPLAKNGNPTAERYLVYMYLRGDIVKQNPVKAFGLFRSAAEQDDLLSVFSLGGALCPGSGRQEE